MVKKKLSIGILIVMTLLYSPMFIKSIQATSNDQTIEITTEFDVKSEYVSIWNIEEQVTIYEKQAHKQMYPASLTKIMTTLVAIEALDDLHETITLEPVVFEGLEEANASMAGYQVNEKAEVIDLLYGIMLPSGAEAARAIAIRIYGSEAAFVEKMNEKAQSLGLEHTHFVNTSGLHDDQHYSCVADLSILLQEALKNEQFQTIFNSKYYETSDHSKTFYATSVSAISTAGIDHDFLIGSKTGYTLEGGLCLASTMEVNGTTYIVITGNAGNDYATLQHILDAYTIYQTLTDQLSMKSIFTTNDEVKKVQIAHGTQAELAVHVANDVQVLARNQEEVSIEYQIDETIQAPIEQGEELGQLVISSSLGLTHTYPLIASTDIARDWPSYILHAWWFYLIVIMLIIVLILWLIRQRNIRKLRKRKRYR